MINCFLIFIYIACFLRIGVANVINPSHSKCIRFTSGGIFFWWQAGAAKYIQTYYDTSNIPIIGSSAGSLTAALLKSNIDFDECALLTLNIGKRMGLWDSNSGLAFIWGSMIEEWLDTLITDFNPNQGNQLYIRVTPLKLIIPRKPIYLSNFTTKASVIDACMASVHIPFFMDGRYSKRCNNKRYIDGSFWPAVKSRIKFLSKSHSMELQPFVNGRRIQSNDVFTIDYEKDEKFCETHKKTSIVELLSPEGLYDMMDAGYKYMEKESSKGTIPLPKKSLSIHPKNTYQSDDA